LIQDAISYEIQRKLNSIFFINMGIETYKSGNDSAFGANAELETGHGQMEGRNWKVMLKLLLERR
jgi:hypothetical protein